MKLTINYLTTLLLSITTLPVIAAKEFNTVSANKLKPDAQVTVNGHTNATLIPATANKKGPTASFIIGNMDINSPRDDTHLVVDRAHPQAPPPSAQANLRVFNGVTELSKDKAYQLEPFATVSISGFFPNQPDVNQLISKAAAKKGAAAFFITRQIHANNGGNQYITAFIYKADAKPRKVQSADLIPSDSKAGKAALAAGGNQAQGVETPGVDYQNTPPSHVGRFYQTQSGTQQRLTVTTSQKNIIQELNDLVAAQMTPFDSITLTAHFATPVEMSEAIANRAEGKGAKYFHIIRQWQNQSGGNLTVTAELFH